MPAIAFGSIDLISRSDLYMRVWSHGPNCGWLNWSVKFRICFHISPTYIHTRHHISHVFLWIYWNNAALTISILIRWWIFISILCFFIFDKKLKKRKKKIGEQLNALHMCVAYVLMHACACAWLFWLSYKMLSAHQFHRFYY